MAICFKVVATSVGGVDSPPSTCLLEVGLGAVKSETGSDVTICGTGSDVKACGGEGGGAVPTLTPGEQPLTESETTASEIETGVPFGRSAAPKPGALTSSLTAMTSSENNRRRRPNRPPSPQLHIP